MTIRTDFPVAVRSTATCSLVWLLFSMPTAAQEEEWIGRRFMPKVNTLAMKPNGEPYFGSLTMPMTVKAVDGDLLDVGDFRYRKQDVVPLERAEGYYTRVIEANPGLAFPYNRRAIIRKTLGKSDEAIEDYSSAIRFDPQAMYYGNRGFLWQFSKQNLDEALKDYAEAIRLDPALPSVYHSRGLIHRSRNDLDAALADFDESLRLDPKYASASSNRGLVWKAKGDLAAAIRDFEDAFRSEPKYADAYLNLAWTLATADDAEFRNGEKAKLAATIACELTSWKQVGPVRSLAAANAELGDFNAAVQIQQKAVELISEKNKPAEQTRLKLYLAGKPYRDKATARGKNGKNVGGASSGKKSG